MTRSDARLELQALNRLEELDRLTEAVDRFLDDLKVDAEMRYAVQFAVEELFTNIVKYAFEDQGSHRVSIQLVRTGPELALIMEDEGRPFDPTAAPVPDTTLALDERPVGGLGLFLLRRMSSGMEYWRTARTNRIRVHFTLPDVA
jgi:anti-sigma regulatory factor (Ser/Thr protein kinase)